MPGDAREPIVFVDAEAAKLVEAVDACNRRLSKEACVTTRELHAERIAHFARRIAELGLSPASVLIVVLNVDDPHGGPLAQKLMPGNDAQWQQLRDMGMVPYARGLAYRTAIEQLIALLDAETARKLSATKGAAVVVMDHRVVEVFDAQ